MPNFDTADLCLTFSGSAETMEVTLSDTATSEVLLLDKVATPKTTDWRGDLARAKSDTALLRTLGEKLTRDFIPSPIARRIVEARSRGPLRLRIAAAHDSAADLPWEYAWIDGLESRHLARDVGITVVRTLGAPSKSVQARSHKLNVAIVWANPASRAHGRLLSVEVESHSVNRALRGPECRAVDVHDLEHATPAMIDRHLKRKPTNVFHFIGHGDLRPSGGVLVLESGERDAESFLYGDELAQLLAGAKVQLAVFSCCESGGTSKSIAAQVARAGIPHVIGMQMEVSDATASQFARVLYASLSEGCPLDFSVQQARMATLSNLGEWGAAVLYSQDPGVPLFLEKEIEPDQVRNNLPGLNAFIGRNQELSQITDLIESEQHRLVSITGMGGMGKTRLALEIGRRQLSNTQRFPDGVWVVDCTPIESEAELLSAILGTLGFQPSARTRQQTIELLSKSHALVILDCFDKLDACRGAVTDLIAFLPRLQILITSRKRLDLSLETEAILGPMPTTHVVAKEAEAVKLFKLAATRAFPGYDMGPDTDATVQQIVNRLDGVPLAIMLAAGRLRDISLSDLHERLKSNPLRMLRTESVAEKRHRDLRLLLDDIVSNLTEQESFNALSLSIFEGGFFVADAEQLFEEPDALNLVTGLRDQGLLVNELAKFGEDAAMRYRMLDIVREHLRTSAQNQVHDWAAKRHALFYLTRAVDLRRKFEGGHWEHASDLLRLELGNFKASARYFASSAQGEQVKQLAHALARLYLEAGFRADFNYLVEHSEPFARKANDERYLIELLGLKGWSARTDGSWQQAERHWSERAEVAKSCRDWDAHGDSLLDVADLRLESGDTDGCREMLDSFWRVVQNIQDQNVTASAMVIEASLSLNIGNRELASAWIKRVEEALKLTDLNHHSLYVLSNLALLHERLGSLRKSALWRKKRIRLTLLGRYYFQTAKSLLPLAKTYMSDAKPFPAAAWLAIVNSMPHEVSALIQRDYRETARNFRKLYGDRILDDAIKNLKGPTWADDANNMFSEDLDEELEDED